MITKNKIFKNIKIKNIILLILIILFFLFIIFIIYKYIKFEYNENFNTENINISDNNDNNNNDNNNDNNDNNEYNIPKVIWTFWDKEELPKIINQIYNNNIKILSDWKINILNDNNIDKYVDNINNKYNTLGASHKSDYIRLKLLEKYGGVWLDASIIINSQSEFNKLLNDSINSKSKLTAFTLYDKDETYLYHQYIESWFLMVPEKSNIIKLWLNEFENAINIGFEEYNKNIINNHKNIKIDNIIYNINDNNNYLIIYTALQVVLQSKIPKDTKIILLKSEDTMYKLASICNFDGECVKTKFNFENIDYTKSLSIPYIKLRSCDRPNLNLDLYI